MVGKQDLSVTGSKYFELMRELSQEYDSDEFIHRKMEGLVGHYKTRTFERDIGTIREIDKLWGGMKYTSRDATLNPDRYVESRTPIGHRFETVMEVNVEHRKTGERSTRYITVGHDYEMSRGDLENAAGDAITKPSPTYQVLGMKPVRGIYNTVQGRP
jgi:hypothetical protein